MTRLGAVMAAPRQRVRHWLERHVRMRFARRLQGDGLEIGALARPLVTHAGMRVTYVDHLDLDGLRRAYPELADQPLVAPDLIDEAETLATVPDRSRDFVVAAHVIEHMRNPLAALDAWCRVVRPGGHVYLIVPDKRVTFDRPRARTSLEHLVLDYLKPSPARDYEHYLDYAVHVQRAATSEDAIAEADRLERAGYSIHFHVFEPSDIVALLGWFAANVRAVQIAEGPVVTPAGDEFHVLVRVLGGDDACVAPTS